MNWDHIAGNWQEAKEKIGEQWVKLSDDHLDRVPGTRDQLVGNIQESYGVTRDEAERQFQAWEARNEATIAGYERPAGTRDQLIGNIQESFGIAKDEAERKVKAWGAQNADKIADYQRPTGGPWTHWPHT